jgi:hypothetical protein
MAKVVIEKNGKVPELSPKNSNISIIMIYENKKLCMLGRLQYPAKEVFIDYVPIDEAFLRDTSNQLYYIY